MSGMKRTLTYSPSIFKGCTSLKALDFSGIGVKCSDSERTRKSVGPNRLAKEKDIYQGCDEISEVVFSPYYPRKTDTADSEGYTGSSGNVPAEKNWVKIANPDPADYPGYPTTYGSADPEYKAGNSEYKGFCELGTKCSSAKLFGNFKPEYAGTWVAESVIALRGNGGTPEYQEFGGARGMAVSFDAQELGIVDPKRNGYKFTGWFSDKANGEGEELKNDGVTTAKSWSYYAHWDENKYNLELYGNGGTATIHNDETGDDETVSSFTAKENLLYSEYFELSNTMFSRPGYVLTGWNTRPNGSGDEYAANDSVNKLMENDGETAKLYAQWHKPDLILRFDANYEGAPSMPSKNYTLKTGETVTYGDLAEATRPGYTFLGWYTDSENGTLIKSTTPVDPQALDPETPTLYAHWVENPTITFDANGGQFVTKSGTSNTVIRQYNYNQNLGVIPTPERSSAVIKGWYTKNGANGDWGNEITAAAENNGTALESPSDKKALATATYYARWGYKPEFESNGGVYDTFPEYKIQDGNQYVIAAVATEGGAPTLPTFKDTTGFKGWFFGDTNLTEYLSTHSSYTLDLSQGKIIEARWEQRDIYNVTLDLGGGTIKDGLPNPIRVYSGDSVQALPAPTKKVGSTEFEFLGWFTEPQNGEKKDYTFVPTGNCTLYAHWAEKTHTVTFDPNGGEMYLDSEATTKVYDNGNVKKLPGANLTGNLLAGWYTDVSDETTRLTTSTPITGNVTYHAKWIPAEDTYVTSDDGLYKYSVKWETPSNEYATNIGDRLIIAPANGNSTLSARLYIRFSIIKSAFQTSGESLPEGSVKIKIPKYIFENIDGNKVGSNNISNGFSMVDTPYSHFIYSDSDPDYYIITNNEAIDKNSEYSDQAFQIDYKLEPNDLRNINGGYIDENGAYGGNYYNRILPIKIQVDKNGDSDNETDYTKNLGVEVHTNVRSSTQKTRTSASFGWRSEWGEAPADADQYFYVIWDLLSSFDSSSSQKYKFSWSEDTVHDGSIVKIINDSKYSETSYMTPNTFHTTVITKHPRKTTDSGWKTVRNEAVLNIEWLSGYKEQIRVTKEDGVYLIPSGTIRVFEKQIKDYNEGADRIKSGGTERILNRSGINDLPFEVIYQEYKNTNEANITWHPNTKTYTAPERNIQISEGAKNSGDVVMSTVQGTSRYNWDNPDNVALSDADYSFSDLEIYLTEFDSVQVNGEWSEPFEHSAFRDYGDVEIWTREANDNEFRLFRRLSASDFRSTDNEHGDDLDNGIAVTSVSLPEDTVGYKVVHKSEFYATKLIVCPNLFLKSSNKVFGYVQDNMVRELSTLIKNNAVLTVDDREPVNSKRMDSGGATVCSYELKTDESYLYATKSCATDSKQFTIDNEAGTQEFPVLISGWGINRAGSIKLIETGVFYDLLPYNFTVDKSTVFVKRRASLQTTNSTHAHAYNQEIKNNTFPTSMYSVDFIENWQGSGRTMMKVTIKGVPDRYKTSINGFNVFYKMKTTMSNVIANGTTQMNYVSFTDTTDNQTVPVARNGALSGLDPKVIQYYKSIDDADGAFTAYASNGTQCQTPVQFATGFNSTVKTDGSFMTGDKTVALDTDYTYNVTFTDGEREASKMIIYDIIENSLTGATYDWKGKFKSVDVSAIANMEDARSSASNKIYCAPKVYYLITDDPITADDLDITKPGWTDTEPAGDDKLRVKAIAIDCRTSSDNGAFVLPGKKALTFNINMTSPETCLNNDVMTYNEAYVKGFMDSEPIDNETLTSVMLHFATPVISKTAFPESGESATQRIGVVNNSTIEYSLTIENNDTLVPIRNIVVEDPLDSKLKINSLPKVRKGDEDPISIKNAAGITYSIEQQSGSDNFVATISSLDPGESMTIIVPATVTDAENGYNIDNTAKITSANGSSADITSETTYHTVTVTQAKIKKVNANGDGLANATLQILSSDKQQVLKEFTSTTGVYTYDLVPGDYVLRETQTPDNTMYKLAADIPFTIDIEGINRVGDKPVNYVEMVDEPAYKVVFHENQPGNVSEKFRVYGPADIKDNGYKINHFYDIPTFAGDDYVFAGWYHLSDGYGETTSPDTESMVPVNFENSYPPVPEQTPQDYHIYAKWIKVGKVDKADGDGNNYAEDLRGFGLAGVQIRIAGMDDSNYGDQEKPQGLRFITSFSQSLYDAIDDLSDELIDGVPVEYGYVVGTESNINVFTSNYNVKDPAKYKLLYKGKNSNGVDTTGEIVSDRSAETDYRYIRNVICTSSHRGEDETLEEGYFVLDDHRNFSNYRLYTLVVTYEGTSANKITNKIDARSYIRYIDANGKERIFYNDYRKNMYYGGCMCSFKQVSTMSQSSTSG